MPKKRGKGKKSVQFVNFKVLKTYEFIRGCADTTHHNNYSRITIGNTFISTNISSFERRPFWDGREVEWTMG